MNVACLHLHKSFEKSMVKIPERNEITGIRGRRLNNWLKDGNKGPHFMVEVIPGVLEGPPLFTAFCKGCEKGLLSLLTTVSVPSKKK